MNPPNAGDNSTQYYSISTPESGEDKAAQTRRKNAEAQKLYRERKKAHEAGLVNQVQILQERINILEAQLAYERKKQNEPWLYPVPESPQYSTYAQAPTNSLSVYGNNYGGVPPRCNNISNMPTDTIGNLFHSQSLGPFTM